MNVGPLIGRDRELRALNDMLDGTAAGSGTTGVVEGMLGSGRTELLAATATTAGRRGFRVFSAAGSQAESGWSGQLVGRLFGDGPVAPGPDRHATCRRVDERVAAAAGAAPVLLVVDDLQWCDRLSLQCLAFLARRIGERRVCLLCAQLTGTACTDAVAADELLRGPRPTTRIELAPSYGPATADAVITRAIGPVDPATRTAITRWTGSNPVLLREVLAALGRCPDGLPAVHEVVPAGVLAWLRARVPSALPVATLLAVLGPGADQEMVAEVTGRTVTQTARTVRVLGELGLVDPDPPHPFRHPVVRAALRTSVTDEDRVRLCVARSRRLRRSGAPAAAEITHLLASGVLDHPEPTHLLLHAVRRHVGDAPPEQQAATARRVLAHRPPRPVQAELLHVLGSAELDLDVRSAEAHLAEARLLLTDPARRAIADLEHAQALHGTGRHADAVRLLDETTRDDDGGLLPDQVAVLRATLAAENPSLPRAGDGRRSGTVGWIVSVLHGAVPETADARLRDAWHLLSPAGSPALPLTWHLLVRALLTTVDARELLPYTTAWCADRQQGPLRRLLAHAEQAEVRLSLGQVDRAATETAEALAVLSTVDRTAPTTPVLAALPALIDTLVERDEQATAAGLLRDTTSAADLPPRWHDAVLLAAEGRLKHAAGDSAGGLRDLLRCADMLPTWGRRPPHPVAWRPTAVDALLVLGRRRAAVELAGQEIDEVRSGPCPRRLGAGLRAAGRAAGGARGIELLTEATAVLGATGDRLELAGALGDLGTLLSRNGRWKVARDRLRHGCALAERCGATRLRRILGARLADAGSRNHARVHGAPALTAGERRVARLAATGRTNGEIAEQLFVTRRAVEMHLTQVYRKLGIAGRGELGTILDAPAATP